MRASIVSQIRFCNVLSSGRRAEIIASAAAVWEENRSILVSAPSGSFPPECAGRTQVGSFNVQSIRRKISDKNCPFPSQSSPSARQFNSLRRWKLTAS